MQRGARLVSTTGFGLLVTTVALGVSAQAAPPAPPPPAAPAAPAAAPPAPAAPAPAVSPAPPAAATPATPPATPPAPAAAPPPAGVPPVAPVAATPAPPAPSGEEPPPTPPAEAGKPPASGFQAAFRLGVIFPMGDATDDGADSLGTRYAWQLPLILDLGARFAESYFAGVYLGIGFGSTGSDTRLEAACTDDDDDGVNDITCNVVSLRAGIEGNYSFMPGEKMNPWIGYGFGYETTTATYTDNERGYKESVTSSGLTFAQLAFGLDMRRSIGVGPFIEAAIGQFNDTTTQIGSEEYEVDINDKAIHAWLMLGIRMVVNP